MGPDHSRMNPGRLHRPVKGSQGVPSAPLPRHHHLLSTHSRDTDNAHQDYEISSRLDSPSCLPTGYRPQHFLRASSHPAERILSPDSTETGHRTENSEFVRRSPYVDSRANFSSSPLSLSSTSDVSAFLVPEIPATSLEAHYDDYITVRSSNPVPRSSSEVMGLTSSCCKGSKQEMPGPSSVPDKTALDVQKIEQKLKAAKLSKSSSDETSSKEGSSTEESTVWSIGGEVACSSQTLKQPEKSFTTILDEDVFGDFALILLREEAQKDNLFQGFYEFNCPTSRKDAHGSRKNAIKDLSPIYAIFHLRGWHWLHPKDRAYTIIYTQTSSHKQSRTPEGEWTSSDED